MREMIHKSGRRLRLNRWLFGWWGEAFLPVDGFRDGTFCDAIVRPRWFWWCRRVRLAWFLVGRRWDEQCSRITPSTAWAAANLPGLSYRRGRLTDGCETFFVAKAGKEAT